MPPRKETKRELTGQNDSNDNPRETKKKKSNTLQIGKNITGDGYPSGSGGAVQLSELVRKGQFNYDLTQEDFGEIYSDSPFLKGGSQLKKLNQISDQPPLPQTQKDDSGYASFISSTFSAGKIERNPLITQSIQKLDEFVSQNQEDLEAFNSIQGTAYTKPEEIYYPEDYSQSPPLQIQQNFDAGSLGGGTNTQGGATSFYYINPSETLDDRSQTENNDVEAEPPHKEKKKKVMFAPDGNLEKTLLFSNPYSPNEEIYYPEDYSQSPLQTQQFSEGSNIGGNPVEAEYAPPFSINQDNFQTDMEQMLQQEKPKDSPEKMLKDIQENNKKIKEANRKLDELRPIMEQLKPIIGRIFERYRQEYLQVPQDQGDRLNDEQMFTMMKLPSLRDLEDEFSYIDHSLTRKTKPIKDTQIAFEALKPHLQSLVAYKTDSQNFSKHKKEVVAIGREMERQWNNRTFNNTAKKRIRNKLKFDFDNNQAESSGTRPLLPSIPQTPGTF